MSQIKVNSIIPTAGLGSGASGGVIQVISATKTNATTISMTGGGTSGNLADLSPTITVTGSNKVLITGFISADKNSSNYYNHIGIMLKRGSTEIGQGDAASSRRRIHSGLATATGYYYSGRGASSGAINFLDSPGAGTHTYNVELTSSYSSNTTIYLNRPSNSSNSIHYGRPVSTLTLMEISV